MIERENIKSLVISVSEAVLGVAARAKMTKNFLNRKMEEYVALKK